MESYDVAVIGGGPSGYAAAMRALDLNKRVLLVEKDKVGGAGIFNGALSSKTLWELSKDARMLYRNDRGFHVHDYTLHYREVMAEVNKAVHQRHRQLEYQLKAMEEQFCCGNFRLVKGTGRMSGPHEVTVEDGQTHLFQSDNIILATGSRPRYLPDIPIDEKIIVTSDGIGSFEDFPESLVILGAGVIGCEFASMFSNFGRTKVYLIDKADRILPFEDQDIAQRVAVNLEANGVTIHRGASLESMTIENERVKYVLRFTDGSVRPFYAAKALVSVGRLPNTENIGALELGIKLSKRGNFEVDDCRTTLPHVYAVGDLTADINLVNVGELEGRHAVEKAYLNKQGCLSYENISTIMFLRPEVAGVGMNETNAREANLNYRVASYSYEYVGRAIAMRNPRGFFKILVTDDDEMRILGMRAIGVHASSTIQAVALLIHMGLSIKELTELPHPHPSMTEGVQECARLLMGTSIIKPQVFGDDALRCHRVIGGVAQPLFA